MKGKSGVTAPGLLRALATGSTLYGAVLVAAPRAAVAAVGGASTPPPSWIVRVLGGRQTGQGLVLLVRPATSTVLASAAVDGLHAVTMVAAAVRWPAYRRVAAASGAVAVISGLLAARSIQDSRRLPA